MGTGPGGPGRPGAPPSPIITTGRYGLVVTGAPGGPRPYRGAAAEAQAARRGPARARQTAAERRHQKQLTLEQALRKAGVHQVPWQRGTPWSIFTNGGGDIVAKAWAVELLKEIRAPVTPGNVAFVYNWQKSEGGGGQFNPLNIGEVPGQPQLTNTANPQYHGGAAGYNSWESGLKGTVMYLNAAPGIANFTPIRDALRRNDPVAARSALIASPWASSHYGGGSGFANDQVPGGNIPGLPPIGPGTGQGAPGSAGSVAGRLTGGGVAGGGGVTHARPRTTGRVTGPQGATGQSGVEPSSSPAVTTSFPGTGGQGGAGNVFTDNPVTFPFVEGFDLTKAAFTQAAGVGEALTAISNNFRAFLHTIDFLVKPSSWVRILLFLGGVTSVGGGVVILAFSGSSLPGGHMSKPVALPVGIASVGFGGILLFFAFHQLPSTVTDLPSLMSYIAADIHTTGTSAPASTATNAIPSVQAT
jgi:hypothetical protein